MCEPGASTDVSDCQGCGADVTLRRRHLLQRAQHRLTDVRHRVNGECNTAFTAVHDLGGFG